MEYHGKFGHNFGRIQHISLISICDATCCLETQTMSPTLPGFQGIKCCVQYLDSQPHKPILYLSNYYDGSNVISLIYIWNKVEDYTTHNVLECHQYADHARIFNRSRSVSGISNTMIGVAFCWKV